MVVSPQSQPIRPMYGFLLRTALSDFGFDLLPSFLLENHPMSEHYTKTTDEAQAWCNHCGRVTKHRVSAGRLAHCLEHEAPHLSQRQIRDRDRRARAEQQPRLFT